MNSAQAVRTVLVVDDLLPTREWLGRAANLAYPQAQCWFAESLSTAQAHLQQQIPDVALIDLRLPDGDGAHLIQALRLSSPAVCLIVPTLFDDDAHLFSALKAGAAGYVLKDQAVDSIAGELLRIHAGMPSLSVPLARRLLRLHTSGSLTLSPEEAALLRARARGTPVNELIAPANGTAPGYLIAAVYARLYGQTLPIGNAV